MMHGDRAGLAETGYRPREIEIAARRIDRAAEPAVRAVMVVYRALMAARNHHHRTVPDLAIVEHDAHGSEIVVGVRIKGPVLMPLDRSPVPSRLHVELAGIEAHRAPEMLQCLDNSRMAGGPRRCGALMRRTRGSSGECDSSLS